MASRIFQNVRKELLKNLTEPRPKFSTEASGSSGSSASKKSIELTTNEKRIYTTLKVMAVFLPGVYIGHVMSDHGFFKRSDGDENEKDEGNDSNDGKGKGKDNKDKKDKK